MNRFAMIAKRALGTGAALVYLAAPAWAVPVVTIGVEAQAANAFVTPGVSRTSSATGALTDAVSEMYGTSTAAASASDDSSGLHASATVHNTSTEFYTASARASAALVNPFHLVARPGFTGATAAIQIGYHLDGSLGDTPGCATCFATLQASLGVDGMADSFFFLGARSLGTFSNPNGYVSGLTMDGLLQGVVPLYTELYVRAGLIVGVHCQAPFDCDTSARGNALNYFGFSSDEVDFVWDLAPSAPPPPGAPVSEPASAGLIALGLVMLGSTQRRRSRKP
jgi:hypothetical protein